MKEMKLYNTLTRSLDEFTPISPDRVTLYTCGPTVYDYLHVGNWAAYVYWDTLVRVLKFNGYEVKRVMNITDVGHLVSDADDGEDKLEKGARRDGKTAWEIAEHYTDAFVRGMHEFGLVAPEHMVRATDFIPQQLALVRTLKEKGYTYQTSDGIYFDTSKFPRYADFAQLDLAAQKAGARVEANSEKRQPWDFALWKFTEPGKRRDMEWETPEDLLDSHGRETPGAASGAAGVIMGFPGWHLECSTMAMELLGQTIDIHTGGIDHIPVHHTNEIAQSEAASGVQFARYWLHCNHLKIDGGKISKSLGNGYTMAHLKERGFTAMDLRMFILQSHYQSEGNFSFDILAAARNRLKNWRDVACLRHQIHDRLNDDTKRNDAPQYFSPQAAIGAMREALNNNLNTPEALSIIDESFSSISQRPLDAIYRTGLVELLQTIDDVLGLQLLDSTPDINDDAKQLLVERRRARDNKNWVRSDELRDQLKTLGIIMRDTAYDTIWTYA